MTNRGVAGGDARIQELERAARDAPPGSPERQRWDQADTEGRPLCAECVEIRRGSSPGPRPDCGLADKLELEAGNYLELDDGHSPPGCCLRVHDACEDIEEEPVDAYLPADAAGLRRIARWLSAWADELDARAREGR